MSDDAGHIELERRVDAISVGIRHRTELGDLRPLMSSIQRLGLLQPVTITPDGVLICGRRRLEAVTRLGWTSVRVWVRSGLSDDLSQLLAQQDENTTHKPLSPIEAAALFREMKTLLHEDAKRRQQATQFGPQPGTPDDRTGGADSAPPQTPPGKARVQAARMVTQRDSHQQLERICEMERIAGDPNQSAAVRQVADDELTMIRNGGPVDPGYQRVKAAARVSEQLQPDHPNEEVDALAEEVLARAKSDRARRVKENRAKRASAAAHARRSVRSFVLMWADLDGWSKHYDTTAVANELTDDDWARFMQVLDETTAFAEAVSLLRDKQAT